MNQASQCALDLLTRVRRHAQDRPDLIAYRQISSDSRADSILSYHQLVQRIDSFASELQQQIAPASVVILQCPNTCNYPIAFLGILAAGFHVFPLSPELTDSEIQSAAITSSARAIVDRDHRIHPLTPSPGAPGEGWAGGSPFTKKECLPGLLLQSSGTTSLPKIVFRSSQSIDAVSANMARSIGFSSSDHVLATVPLCHSYGVEHGLLAPLFAGSTVHLLQGFDLNLILRELTTQNISIFPGVPSMFEMLAHLADPTLRLPNLRAAYSAGAPLPANVYDALLTKYGLKISQLYGATEIGSITYSNPNSPNFDPRSVGRAMDGVIIKIVDLADSKTPLPPGHEGEIRIKAPSMFSGYLPLTSPAPEFFSTGDIGKLDSTGNLTLTGRLKLLIDVGGLKVNPLEVESILEQHPDVAECIVVPIRLSDTVFRLKALIVPSDLTRAPKADDLRAFLRTRLIAYKIPRIFENRHSLPKSATGKVLRHLVQP